MNLNLLQTAIESKLEQIEQILGPNYKLTLICSHNGAHDLKDVDLVLTMTDRDAVMKAVDRFLPMPVPPPLLTQEELYAAMGKLINHIEACGGSPQLTTTVMLASDISQAIGNQWNPANEYAAQRVREIIQPAQA